MCGPTSTTPAMVYKQQATQSIYKTDQQTTLQKTSQLPLAAPQTAAPLEKTKRAALNTTLTAEEEARLKEHEPPPPDFDILTPAQVERLGKFAKKAYVQKKEAYDERVKTWKAKHKFQKDAVKASIQARQQGETWPRLEATPDAMDLALKRNALDHRELSELAKLEYNAWVKGGNYAAKDYLQSYMQETHIANDMNDYLRTGAGKSFTSDWADQAKAALGKKKMTHDMVSRRGVGFDALAGMMGLKDATPVQAKAKLQEQLATGKDVILTEKGFCSTSIRENAGYPSTGIEFIILTRKGTSAIDFSNHGSRDSEKELLINAGTKFRVVKAFFNDGTPGSQREILMNETKGQVSSWKIYLESIPQDAPGVER